MKTVAEVIESIEEDIRPTILGWLKHGYSAGVYQNQALDSANAGHVVALKVGKGCTHEVAPNQLPDMPSIGVGWKYRLVRVLNPNDIE